MMLRGLEGNLIQTSNMNVIRELLHIKHNFANDIVP